jgi:hypothetical protein
MILGFISLRSVLGCSWIGENRAGYPTAAGYMGLRQRILQRQYDAGGID